MPKLSHTNYRKTANKASRRLMNKYAIEKALEASFTGVKQHLKKPLSRDVTKRIWQKITKHRIISKSLKEARKAFVNSHKKSGMKKSYKKRSYKKN